MNIIYKIIAIIGVIFFAWFLIFLFKYGWETNQVNISTGIIGSIFIVGGLTLMQKTKR